MSHRKISRTGLRLEQAAAAPDSGRVLHAARRTVNLGPAAALAAFVMLMPLAAPHAHAEPVGDLGVPPGNVEVPSAPPAVTEFADGYTLSLVASAESQQPIPALTPDLISRDVIVGGIFTGSIKRSGTTATATGSIEVGYQVGCDSPNSMLFGMMDQLKPGENAVIVSQQEFSGATPTVEIEGYRLHIDRCPGPAFIRSYAVLTRVAAQSSSAVYYYGVPKRVDPLPIPS